MGTSSKVVTLTTESRRTIAVRSRVCIHVLREARADIRVVRAASALAAAGYAVSVIDVETNPTLAQKEDLAGARLEHLIVPDWHTSRRFEPWFLLVAVRTFMRSIFQLLRVRADIYHANELTALPACFIAALLRRKPLVFEIYDLQFPVPYTQIVFWRRLGASLYALLLPHCAGVIVTSPLHGREVQRRYHVPATALVRNVPAYRQVSRSDRLRQHLHLATDVRLALYQGNIQSDRGLDQAGAGCTLPGTRARHRADGQGHRDNTERVGAAHRPPGGSRSRQDHPACALRRPAGLQGLRRHRPDHLYVGTLTEC